MDLKKIRWNYVFKLLVKITVPIGLLFLFVVSYIQEDPYFMATGLVMLIVGQWWYITTLKFQIGELEARISHHKHPDF